jgi:hypothetical protein
MIIVIKDQASSDIITLSCVTSFDESYTGSVSSHPIESGSTITDHVTSDNDKFKVSGVVSDYDFLNPSKDLAFGKEGYSDEGRSAATSRFTNGLLDSGLIDIPDKQRAEYIKRRLIDIRKNSLLVTILEYPDSGELVQHTDCILTSLSFKEDENTGYAVYPDMSFEKINVVQVKVEEVNTSKIPKLPDSKVSDAAASVKEEGSTDVCHGRSLKQAYTYNGRDGTITVERGIARFYAQYTTASGIITEDKEIPYPKEWPKWTDKCVLIGNEQELVKQTSLDKKIDLNAKYKVAESLAKQAQAESREFGFVTKSTHAKLKAARDALNQPEEVGN